MVDRSNIGRRVRAKSLKKRVADEKNNPDKYNKPMSDESRFLALDYDYKKGLLFGNKEEEYLRLKREREEK